MDTGEEIPVRMELNLESTIAQAIDALESIWVKIMANMTKSSEVGKCQRL